MRLPAPTRTESRAVTRRRRIVVAVVMLIGAALLGYSLTRAPGDDSFYWLTLALAVVWAAGAFASGPLPLGSDRRPAITGTVVGAALGGLFLLGGLIAREIPGVREFVTRVLEFAVQGALPLVVFITLINGIAEELFFRGALYTALGKAYPAVVSTIIYVVAMWPPATRCWCSPRWSWVRSVRTSAESPAACWHRYSPTSSGA